MERERPLNRHHPNPGGNDNSGGEDPLESVRARLGGMLGAVDRALDSIRPVVAEDFLQQNRQQGAQ
jgi:hypothetical protein